MAAIPRIHVLTGGPYHPVADQFEVVAERLGDRAVVELRDGVSALDDLDGCDLFVAAGLHWTGMDGLPQSGPPWPDGVAATSYRSPDERRRQAFADYVSSGKPLLAWHGGTGSFDDWPEFGRLLGFRWVWGTTSHSAYDRWRVEVEPTGHPAVAGAESFDVTDELYYDVEFAEDMRVAVHATADYDGAKRPMVVTAEGGRAPGAGRTAFLANGHDMRAFDAEPFLRIVVNTVDWLLSA
ncbi:MAG TPA: ThuA domain-containing protein [Gaiellaceae bacterium]|nr:ThuA domain-containing protein [Gaiellaceae bacterium]